ncbi:MAG: hypothetical protein EOO74_01865 [Myxococcales bacterium]|nr:MAG: hypothetical protein EOO74_01865 [Myxococcales bacterium]
MPPSRLPRPSAARKFLDLPSHLASFLRLDLSQLALESGAVQRWRVLQDGAQLLGLCLTYTLCALALAPCARIAPGRRALGESALRSRLSAAAPFVEALLGRLLAHRLRRFRRAGPGLRLYDTSTVQLPGGDRYRVHASVDPTRAEAVGLELTDASSGEWMDHATFGPGDVVLADRGLGRVAEFFTIEERRAYALMRVHLPNVPMASELRTTAFAVTRRACAGELETDVTLEHPTDKTRSLAARLVVVPLPPEQAARARQGVRKAAKKRKRAPDAVTLRLAGYVVLLSTVPTHVADARTLASWYRLRWQVELFFKRCKSLMKLVPRKKVGQALARTLLLTSLLTAVWLTAQIPDDVPSVWRALATLVTMVCASWLASAAERLGREWLTEGAKLGGRERAGRARAREAALQALEVLREAGRKGCLVA